jgi:3-isopropylmalate dehydrogenase
MDFNIAVMPGDGIGPEVVAQGVAILQAVGKASGHTFDLSYYDVGGISIDRHGTALRDEDLEAAAGVDAILFGSVGGPKWDNPQAPTRPEDGLLALRKRLGLFANLRPVKVFPALVDASVIKPSVLEGVDVLVVRELTGGIYYGRPRGRRQTKRGWSAVDTMRYSEAEIERVLRVGFESARERRKHLCSVDKANVLETSRLWRRIATDMAAEYPDVTLEHMLVDTCAMQLVQRPTRFDVIVAENTFGDILTDEAAVLSASMGLLPSASLAGVPVAGATTMGMYEPIHGSAPDIAGKGIANPIATILSVALMLRYSLGLAEEGAMVEAAVERVLQNGHRTPDLATQNDTALGTEDMGACILDALA